MAQIESFLLKTYEISPFAIKIHLSTLFLVTCIAVKLYTYVKSMTASRRMWGVSAAHLAHGHSTTH